MGRYRGQRPQRGRPTTSTATATARSRSVDRGARAADTAVTIAARGCRPSCQWHQQRGFPRRSCVPGHRVRTLPFRVSNVLPPFLVTVASGSAAEEPSTSLRLGPAGPLCWACCAAAHTCFCIFSVFLWPPLSWSAICGGIPHFAALVSTYLIILISASPKFLISLQASSGAA